MGGKKMFFGSKKYAINTWIGGVASYIPTVEDYLAKVTTGVLSGVKNYSTINVNDIELSQIDDVEMNHTLTTIGPFKGVASAKYYIDLTGKIKRISSKEAFMNSGFEYLYFPGLTSLSNHVSYPKLQNLTHLKRINIISLENIDAVSNFSNAESLINFYIPNATDIITNRNFLMNAKAMKRVYIPMISIMTDNIHLNAIAFQRSVGSGKIYYNSNLGVKDRKAWLDFKITNRPLLGEKLYVNGLEYRVVDGGVINAGDVSRDGNVNNFRDSFMNAVNNDTRTGLHGKVTIQRLANWNSDHGFQTSVSGVSGNSIVVTGSFSNVSFPHGTTFKGGYDVAQVLQCARDYYGYELVELSAPISVNTPSSLSHSNLTSNSVQLNFIEPSANANGTECFEVWIEDSTVYRKMFEYSEISGSGQTVDLTEIVNDANSSGISGIKIKIRTMDGQMNYSEFSNEITLP